MSLISPCGLRTWAFSELGCHGFSPQTSPPRVANRSCYVSDPGRTQHVTPNCSSFPGCHCLLKLDPRLVHQHGSPPVATNPRLASARLFPLGAGSPTHILVPLLLACLHGQRLHFTLELVHLHVQGVDGVLGERASKGRWSARVPMDARDWGPEVPSSSLP